MSDANKITTQDVSDTWENAICSIGYWAGRADYVTMDKITHRYGGDYLADGGVIHVYEEDTKERTCRSLTRVKLESGIRKAAEHRGLTVRRFMDEQDVEDADIAVQLALFGEIVYG